MTLPSKLFYVPKGATVVVEFIPTMLISARCKVTDCPNRGDYRDMANGVCDTCWRENEEWRQQQTAAKPRMIGGYVY